MGFKTLWVCALLAGLGGFADQLIAAAPVLSAGAARADITPDREMPNWATSPLQPYRTQREPIFARALVLADEHTRVALLGWDLTDAREYAVARVRQAIAAATGIPETHIAIQATDNHSAPRSELGPGPHGAVEKRVMLPAQQDPRYRAWADQLVATCVDLVRQADRARQPIDVTLARASVGEWLFNRWPTRPDGQAQSLPTPPDPHVLRDGLRFRGVDPTLTLLRLRTPDGTNVATLFHLPAHAVTLYQSYQGLAADWPGPVMTRLRQAWGGEAFFLQGATGNIVPARRGVDASAALSQFVGDRALAAGSVLSPVALGPLRASRARLGLPVHAAAEKELGRSTVEAEVQVFTAGTLALVMLPGEPFQEIALAIQERSPFAHTLTLGYANGKGVGYVALSEDPRDGGYRLARPVGWGADEAGRFLVATAGRLLEEHAAGQP